MKNMPITLDELLASRDARHAMQQKLMAEQSGKTLVCLTVVMPGSVKRNQQSLIVARAAVEAMRKAYNISDDLLPETELLTNELKTEAGECLVERDLNTGYEAYLITPLPLLEAKRVAVDIEDTHPLGRLFDIDVIDAQGIPVSRDRVGGQPRRCLVCDHEARYCMRMRWHTQEEIWARIKQMTDDYALQQQA
ncbi:citrate lyase holo-[acyl-carrier protein] synthase [Prevotella sp.]|uniref:citrate lyase holo-[acyl-carrier protein] synthase n=1 Tax=Prevotella sp. TaxID=59823 RepID=UPI0025FD9F5E|nr:citrate lyase holo-[acyl-carrier protein] synthase [Prevotella sp.]